ncbi:RHOMBOID-like protein 8 [Arabidopsis thaliana]|uniref:RHOMBOID-like protein n=3 Tax=Arabidopsis TaxID=3701 RepID=A0A178W8L8_ARATH|nr:Rhomboid-related intramembrane serine protease family protein [Arabidopsis thaliana]ANM58585.1 Rhomboid-related intramembrane serine protease family protein [Arabidopsis thaliana]KAG7652088.1 Peptidase S54 rhomboid domain [Arabidopsis thaliana x Arabidopsis arenosa]OAP14799.1 KOM [Arabidopsis thaliana]BAK20219.1 Rhomboid family KOMPEITO [Arabidopsis thaliana]|eukprot:NP_001321009.1 Rhomboid-related intramembrane serine protease family protein [Arabidopsis thaliana]
MEVPTESKTTQIDEISHNLSFTTSNAGDSSWDKISFFRHRSRQIKRDTWLVSVFVLLQIVLFAVTMGVNDCSGNSHGHCSAKLLGRFSFQSLSENPMLGPSASTLEHMGGLSWKALTENHEIWRILTSPWLHSGLFHLFINLGSLIFVGIYMEQQFGPLRIAVIYFLSGIMGSLFAVLFVRNIPSISSGAAFFGLIGAMLSALAKNWNLYNSKISALAIIFTIFTVNFLIGFLPFIDNFANIGGFISGFLLGFVLLFKPQLRQMPPSHKGKLFEDDMNRSTRLKEQFDRPVLRIICLLVFCGILAGVLLAACWGVNLNRHCHWCRYVDCVPTKKWSCSDMTTSCEAMVSDAQLTLTCMANGKFRIFPFTNISQARTEDLCTLVCS